MVDKSPNRNGDFSTVAESAEEFRKHLLKVLSSRGIDPQIFSDAQDLFIPSVLSRFSKELRAKSRDAEADALDQVHEKVIDSPSFGGLGLHEHAVPTASQFEEAVFLCEAWLESVKSKQSARTFLDINETRSRGVRPMTLAQKIFTQHALSSVGPEGGISTGSVIRVGVDWILASELSWKAMAATHEEIGSPGIWRNDRLWIAGDHVAHPSIYDDPKIKTYIDASEKAKKQFLMTENQGMNYTIMHTEFVRERAEPGMLAIGSDSHSCSAGAVGCLGIGLGTADVMMTCALGETWFKMPESILIEFVGQPAFGISGKDVILAIMKELKRNTVAAERIVEFSGTGAQYLSTDARFAICNMCTEFGAITGAFVPDAVTKAYIARRRRKANKSNSVFFKPDQDAEYAGRFTIDLSQVESSIAVYPQPDNVVPVSEKAGMHLDGVFIGACTTTEEELVLAALVLKVGLARKLPLAKGKRHYVPGSLPIVHKLEELGLLEIYQEAGFTRGPPGCSMCVGLTAEKANKGETWLSSQNRNFENRMGPGSFGHVSSAMVCAASAFGMVVTSPAEFLKDIDEEFFKYYKGAKEGDPTEEVHYVEPKPQADVAAPVVSTPPSASEGAPDTPPASQGITTIESKIITLPDFVDTDALSPGWTLTNCKTDEEFGQHVLEHTHPDFRRQVAEGQRVVVAGNAFGVGSSRETAVSALKGAGVRCVIARSFAFIYARNQPSLGLLGITMDDDAFFAAAVDGEDIVVDVPARTITVARHHRFPFQLSEMEHNLTMNQGVAKSYRKYGRTIWEKMMQASGAEASGGSASAAAAKGHEIPVDSRLKW